MRIYHFEEIEAWKKSQVVTVQIYKLLQGNLDYGFKTRYNERPFLFQITLQRDLKEDQMLIFESFYLSL